MEKLSSHSHAWPTFPYLYSNYRHHCPYYCSLPWTYPLMTGKFTTYFSQEQLSLQQSCHRKSINSFAFQIWFDVELISSFSCERHYFVILCLLLMIEIPKNKFGYAAISKIKGILKYFTRSASSHTCYTNLLLSSPVSLFTSYFVLNFYSYWRHTDTG